MLSSISPVGEASRGQRWGLTASAYVIGSVAAGTAVGAAVGLAGAGVAAVAPTPPVDPLVLSVLALLLLVGAGLVTDARDGVPGLHRQVDRRWLTTYRGWVYGLGFGAQLGTGVVTVIPSSVVWAMWGTAALTASPAAGASIGVVFGLLRAVPVVLAGGLRTPAQLRTALRRIDRARRPVTQMTVAGQVAVAVVVVIALARDTL